MSVDNLDPVPLQVKLKPSHLRPIAYRILSKKHGLHVKSNALVVLTDYIGANFGSEWKSPNALKFLEEVAKSWKAKFQANKNLFIDGENLQIIIGEINEKSYANKENKRFGAQNNLDSFLLKKNGVTQNGEVASRTDTIVDEDIEDEDDTKRRKRRDENHVVTFLDDFDSSFKGSSQVKKFNLYDYFHIKDYFELPIPKYNHSKKKYEPYMAAQDKLQQETSLAKKLAFNFNVQDNLNIYMQRYYQAYHRLLRNESFKFSSAIDPTSSTYFDELELLDTSNELSKLKSLNQNIKQITLIKNLLGRHGKQFIIFGLLTKNQEGNYKLQDSSDSIQLDLSKCFPDESYFYFEGCLLICDGIYINFGGRSKFVANLIYHPKAELRADFYKNFGLLDFQSEKLDLINPKVIDDYDLYKEQLISESRTIANISAGTENGKDGLENSDSTLDKIVFLGSRVCLDSLKTLEYLRKLFTKLSKDSKKLPIAIVFPGSFVSKSFEVSSVSSLGENSSMSYKNFFDSLAIMLSNFPDLCASTQFVFVGGYNDPWNSLVYQGSKSVAMPYSRLSKMFFNRLGKIIKNLKIVTNPFKMYHLNSEISILNDDIYERMIKNDIPFNYYAEKRQLIKSFTSGNLNMDTDMNGINNEENYIEGMADDDDDEDMRTTKSLLSKQISNLKNLNISSLELNSLRKTDAKAFKQDVTKLVNTIVNQSHLSPFATNVKPVVWKYDFLMSMNPLPSTLILFDSTIGFFDEVASGVKVVNVGRFISEDNRAANYVEYFPATQRAEWKKIFNSYS